MQALYERLRVWQLAHELTLEIYKVTATFPSSEKYGLTAQLRRAAAAVPTNIVEGNARRHRREYIHYCLIARASIAETKYLLRLSLDLKLISLEKYESLFAGYDEAGRMLQALINHLDRSNP